MWLSDLTVALVAKDLEKFEKILAEQPKDMTASDAAEAMALIKEAQQICADKILALNTEFEKIKLAKKYSQDMI